MAKEESGRQGWSYFNPTQVIFGYDGLEQLREHLITGGQKQVAIVAGIGSAAANGRIDFVQSQLGLEATVYTGIDPEPTQGDAQRLRVFLDDKRPETVIALGGGSVIDAAKVACVAAGSDVGIRELMDRKVTPDRRPFKLVALPTTAGSGSEVTPFAVLTNDSTGLKQSLPSPYLYPDLAVTVPSFLATVPRRVASETGMDALAHAFEALWSLKANPASDGLAYAAIRRIAHHFIKHLNDPSNPTHATEMATAATLAGLAFSNTFTAACHALSYPISARFGLSHGAACAATLDLIAEVNATAVESKYSIVTDLLSLQGRSQIGRLIADLRRSTGCVAALSELKPTDEDLEMIATNAFAPLMANNPVPLDPVTIKRVLGAKRKSVSD